MSFKAWFLRLRRLLQNIYISLRMLGDHRIPKWRKLVFIGLSVGYFLWPYDGILDFLPFGQLDDLGVFLAIYSWFMAQIPESIRKEYGWKEMF